MARLLSCKQLNREGISGRDAQNKPWEHRGHRFRVKGTAGADVDACCYAGKSPELARTRIQNSVRSSHGSNCRGSVSERKSCGTNSVRAKKPLEGSGHKSGQ